METARSRYAARSTFPPAATGDLNGDGCRTLLHRGQQHRINLVGNGDGTFMPAASYPSRLIRRRRPSRPGCRYALTWWSPIPGQIQCRSFWAEATEPAPRADVGRPSDAIAVADFNGDGRPDLAIANSGADNLAVLPVGDGISAPGRALLTAPSGLVAGDFNRDGNPISSPPTGKATRSPCC